MSVTAGTGREVAVAPKVGRVMAFIGAVKNMFSEYKRRREGFSGATLATPAAPVTTGPVLELDANQNQALEVVKGWENTKRSNGSKTNPQAGAVTAMKVAITAKINDLDLPPNNKKQLAKLAKSKFKTLRSELVKLKASKNLSKLSPSGRMELVVEVNKKVEELNNSVLKAIKSALHKDQVNRLRAQTVIVDNTDAITGVVNVEKVTTEKETKKVSNVPGDKEIAYHLEEFLKQHRANRNPYLTMDEGQLDRAEKKLNNALRKLEKAKAASARHQ